MQKKNSTRDTMERYHIKVATMGWVCVKEFGYLSVSAEITDVAILFGSVTVYEKSLKSTQPVGDGVGVDLGILDFAMAIPW